MNQQNIHALVERVQKGQIEAFEILVMELQSEVRMFVAARAGAWDLVEEVVQSSFVVAFQKISDYRPEGSFLGWLKAIARNRLHEEVRDRARYAQGPAERIEAVVSERLLQTAEADDDTAGRLERLRECLRRLQPHARELIRRRYELQTSLAQLAIQFKRTRDAIAGTIKRARHSLRLCVEGSH